jgi:hypothetical protein
LGIVVELFKSLINFITSIRNDKCFNEFLILAKKINSKEYEFDKVRTKKCKIQAAETRENEVHMTGSDKLRIETYFIILNRVKSEIEKRCVAYIYTFDKYDFTTNLILLSPEEIT